MTEKPIRIGWTCVYCGGDDMQTWPSTPGWAECGSCFAEYEHSDAGIKPISEPATYNPLDDHRAERRQMGIDF